MDFFSFFLKKGDKKMFQNRKEVLPENSKEIFLITKGVTGDRIPCIPDGKIGVRNDPRFYPSGLDSDLLVGCVA